MSIFGKIASAIFGITPAHAEGAPEAVPVGAPAAAAPAAAPGVAPIIVAASSAPTPAATPATAPAVAAAAVKPVVDVAKVLDGIKAKQKEDLDWRKSIVDLMKVLELDSSLKARQELAKELKYEGDMNDSAKMNIWLHKQVMNKLAANGGKVPADLKD